MIISHKYKFIFIKTVKTAGSSIETYLSSFLGNNDICTPLVLEEATKDYYAQNYKGYFNPFPDFMHFINRFNKTTKKIQKIGGIFLRFISKKRFYNHIPAWVIKTRIPKKIWKNYYTFCFERNPWDKTLSHYHWINQKGNLTFDEYIKQGRFCYNYWRYMDIKNENIIVDHVGKYENLSEELSNIFDYLGIPFKGTLEIRAKGQYKKDRRPYQEVFLNDYQKYKDTIERIFQKEIKLHEYKF